MLTDYSTSSHDVNKPITDIPYSEYDVTSLDVTLNELSDNEYVVTSDGVLYSQLIDPNSEFFDPDYYFNHMLQQTTSFKTTTTVAPTPSLLPSGKQPVAIGNYT